MSAPLNTVGGRVKPYLKTALTATGTNQATAYPLVNNAIHEFTTTASGTGAILPVPEITTEITITNSGVSSLTVYPPVGGTIANGTVNAGAALTAASSVTYYANSLTNWYPLNVASGSGGSGTVTDVTFTGDGVLLSSTPSTDVTTTGTLPATQATCAAHTILSNTTGGTAKAGFSTLTAIIDSAIASVQGDLLYRGASAWSALAPGTAGQFLQSGGSAANPSFTADLAAGTNGNLAFTGISHGTVAAGDLWFPSSDQGTFAIGRSSGAARLGGCIFSCGACTAVANTVTATSIFGTPTGAKGSLTLPANTLVAGNLLRWYLTGTFNAVATVNISFNYKLGSSTIHSSTAPASITASVTTHPATTNQNNYMSILTTGSSATVCGVGVLTLFPTAAALSHVALPGGPTPAASATFDSTADALFDIAVTWGTQATGNSFALSGFQLFLDN